MQAFFIGDAKLAEKLFKKNDDERYKLAQKLQNVDTSQADTIKEIEKELSLLKDDGKYTALSRNDDLPEYDDIEEAKKYYDMLFSSTIKDKNIDKIHPECYLFAVFTHLKIILWTRKNLYRLCKTADCCARNVIGYREPNRLVPTGISKTASGI